MWTQKLLQQNVLYQGKKQANDTTVSDSPHRRRKFRCRHCNLCACTISNSKAEQDEEWRSTIILNDKSVVFRLDTGVECNVISMEVYDSVSKQSLQKTRMKLVAFGGHKLNSCGKAHILCEYKGWYRVLEFVIVDGNVQNVLGKRSCSELTLVKRVDAIERCITDNYADIFQGLGCIKDVIHHIKLDKSARPVVHPPRIGSLYH